MIGFWKHFQLCCHDQFVNMNLNALDFFSIGPIIFKWQDTKFPKQQQISSFFIDLVIKKRLWYLKISLAVPN